MDTLNCSICYLRYDNNQRRAVSLPCGHTFCSTCTASSCNKCPACREGFTDVQVKKNYALHRVLEEIGVQPVIERCTTHKREMDRFCKSCLKLMCSVCHCSHLGSTSTIISDMNLREEVERIMKTTYRDVGKAKQEFSQRVDNHVQKKTLETNKKVVSDHKKLDQSAQADIKKIETEKEANITKLEQEAKRKIEQIKHKLGVQVNLLFLEQDKLIKDMKHSLESFTRQIETLQDLSEFPNSSLDECLEIYKLEQLQRNQLQECLKMSKREIDSFFPAKRFEVGEIVDCLYNQEWVNAIVKNVLSNQVVIQHNDGSEERLDIKSPWLFKKWEKGDEFHIGHRIHLLTSGSSRETVEARVVEVKEDKIRVSCAKGWKATLEIVRKDSDRILECNR